MAGEEELFVLTAEDADKLKQFMREAKTALGLDPTSGPGVLPGTTEILIALTPPGGIPALGEGTGTGGFTDLPGSALCDIYRVTEYGSGQYALSPVTGLQKRVLNVNEAPIGGSKYIIIGRTRQGFWVPMQSLGDEQEAGTGTAASEIEITEMRCSGSFIETRTVTIRLVGGVLEAEYGSWTGGS